MTRLTWGGGDLACSDTPTGDALITSAAYSYTSDGSATAFTFGNGLVETRRKNYRGQPTQISLSSSLWSLTNDYGTTTNNGNVLVQTLTAPGLSLYQKYRYDGVNRLDLAGEFTTNRSLSACPDSNSVWCQAYGFDQYGNRRITGRTPDTTSPSEPAAYNSTNNHVTGTNWGYTDERGNLTSMPYAGGAKTFSYDAEDRLKSVNGTALKFSYDGEGRRVKRTVNGEDAVFYVYDAKGELVAEYGSAAAGGRQYVTTDHLGSTRVITNGTGGVVTRLDYLPFGEEITVSGSPNPRQGITGYGNASTPGDLALKFTGKERDSETGLDFFGARYMSSAQGRFTSPDPLLNSGRPDDPQSWNRYAYVNNNPLRYRDPLGLYKWSTDCEETDGSSCKAERDRFRTAYANLKKAATGLEKGSDERKQLEKVIKRIGDEGKGSVRVAFGDAGHDKNGNPYFGDTTGNTMTFNLSALSKMEQSYGLTQAEAAVADAGLVGHEGGHLSSSGFLGIGKLPGLSLLEHGEGRALYTESATYQGLSYNDKMYKLWNNSWTKVDGVTVPRAVTEQYRTTAIQNELDRQAAVGKNDNPQ